LQHLLNGSPANRGAHWPNSGCSKC
jgi:hypothetical protein